jgi:hypothetical protein
MAKLKHMIVAGAAVVTLGASGSVALATSAHATDGHDGDVKSFLQDRMPNNQWRILQYLKQNFDTIKKEGPLLHEHAAITFTVLRAEVQGSSDLTAATKADDTNAQQLATAVDTLYPGTHDKFLEQWRGHLTYYTDYVKAKKANDATGQATAKANLKTFATNTAKLLADASMRVNQSDLTAKLQMHTDGTLAVIDAMVAGDWNKAYMLNHDGFVGMTDLSLSLLMSAQFKS